jgi:SAM-dependent methyltransferase
LPITYYLLLITFSMAKESTTQSFYDRIADVHNLAMKINGYRDSVAKYLNSLNLNLDSNSLVLDAGCGTGFSDPGAL